MGIESAEQALQGGAQDFITSKDTKGKVIFWDIDGTLAPFRFNGHITAPDGTEYAMSDEEVKDGVFLHREPSRFMQSVIKTSEAKEHIL